MLTYQVRRREFILGQGPMPAFPSPVEAWFLLGPPQPFGLSGTGGRTALRDEPAEVVGDPNTGRYWMESDRALEPLRLSVDEPTLGRVELRGNELYVANICNSLDELHQLLESWCWVLPMLLNVGFSDPPVVEMVRGTVGNTEFKWVFAPWKSWWENTTQLEQEEAVQQGLRRLTLFTGGESRRVLAALHYFHVACRLERAGHSPWEFMSEVILNLCKVLEVLFPASARVGSRDAARAGLKKLGYTKDEIETNFLPAMALRDKVDVAHGFLSVLTIEQLGVLHEYADSAELAFRKMVRRLLRGLESGEFQLDPYPDLDATREVLKIVERLARNRD